MRWPLLLTPYLLAAACVAGGWLWHLGDVQAGLSPMQAGTVTIGGAFALTDQDGHLKRDTDFRGKYMLVFFGYTYCPDVCPTTLAELSQVMEKLGAQARTVVPVFITVDPERDTAEKMKNYLAPFGPRFVGLTGSNADVAAAARAYHVYSRKHPQPEGGYSMDHSSVIYLMGPDGSFVTNYTIEQGPDAIADDLRKRI